MKEKEALGAVGVKGETHGSSLCQREEHGSSLCEGEGHGEQFVKERDMGNSLC